MWTINKTSFGTSRILSLKGCWHQSVWELLNWKIYFHNLSNFIEKILCQCYFAFCWVWNLAMQMQQLICHLFNNHCSVPAPGQVQKGTKNIRQAPSLEHLQFQSLYCAHICIPISLLHWNLGLCLCVWVQVPPKYLCLDAPQRTLALTVSKLKFHMH